jgi:hypothetical protein
MPRFFNLAGVTPEVFILFLLMLKYDHFFGQIGGRVSTKLMILGSPIVHHLLAMLEDTRVFPYFETKHHNMMLMCHGHVFHFVTAICGQPNNANRSMRAMVINHILNHILSRIACDPAIALGASPSDPSPATITYSAGNVELNKPLLVQGVDVASVATFKAACACRFTSSLRIV